MTAVTITDLNNTKTDVDHIADVSTSTSPTATDRLGHVKPTVFGAVATIAAFTSRGAWAGPGTVYALKDLVLQAGTWYVCVIAHSSAAAFATDAANWRVYQGVVDADLRLADYTAMRAYVGAAASVLLTSPGVAGQFYWDAADAASADNGGTIIVASNGKRWKRVYAGAIHFRWFGALADGVTDDSAAIRSAISAAPTGSTLRFSSGTYLVTQDGANVWCIQFTKSVALEAEPGVEIKANTNGVRTVLRFDAAVVSDAAIVVNGNSKANIAVEVNSQGAGTCLKHWEGKNLTQQYLNTTQAIGFRVASAVGVTFEQCYAHDVTSYVNGVESDNAGAARGFLFDGTNAAAFGVNKVISCRVSNILNDRGAAGDYEDEDGVVTQMGNSRLIAQNNLITTCMKRGIKCQNPATVSGNTILSSRTLGVASGVLDGTKGMYSGISVYSDDSIVEDNLIASTSSFDGTTGGTFAYGVEAGITAAAMYRTAVLNNIIKIGPASNARARELIKLLGAHIGLRVAGNKVDVDSALTLSNTFGLKLDGDHATLRATVNIEDNDFSFLTSAIYLRGGFSGTVRGNKIRALQGPWGIAVDTHSFTLNPKSLVIANNQGYGLASNFTVRVNDTGVVGLTLEGNMSDSATLSPCFVAAGIRYSEVASNGTGRASVEYGTAPPASGTYIQGDVRYNTGTGPGSPVLQWVCTAGGTPGTWRAAEWITSKNTTAGRPTLTANDVGVGYLDTTLNANGKPITWTGTAWVDATGAVV